MTINAITEANGNELILDDQRGEYISCKSMVTHNFYIKFIAKK